MPKILRIGIVILSLLLAGLVALLSLRGYKFFFIATPSMGMTAPVGSLTVVKPQSSYQTNDIIAFQQDDRVYTHRISQQLATGFKTKGDLNHAEDTWEVQPSAIIGKVTTIIYHLGWLWRALPWLIFGLVLLWLISSLKAINIHWRWPIRLIGMSILITAITIWLRPWLNFTVLSFAHNDQRSVNMRIVNTGIFDIRAYDTRLTPGQDAVIEVTEIDHKGRFVLVPRPALRWWQIIAVTLFCLIPLMISLTVELPKSAVYSRKNKTGRIILVVAIIAGTVVIMLLQFTSMAAIVATVNNDKNQARTAPHFTCRNAMQYGLPRPKAAYGMNQRVSFWSAQTEPDLSTNNNRGEFRRNAYFNSGYDPEYACKRDTPRQALFFNGNQEQQCLAVPVRYRYQDINEFSLEIWFKTNSRGANNGKLIGFGDTKFEDNAANDRHIYLDKDGRVVFGTYRYQVFTLASPAGKNYADDRWHHVVATFSTTAGSRLYIDGDEVAANPNMRQAQDYNGYWRMGCGRLAGWRNADGSLLSGQNFFYGHLQFGAVYHSILSAEQVKNRFIAGN